MKNWRKTGLPVFLLIICALFGYGCTAMMFDADIAPDKAAFPANATGVYRTPESIECISAGNLVGGTVVGGGIGAQHAMRSDGKAMQDRLSLPEFGCLVLSNIAVMAREIPGWPAVTIGTSALPPDEKAKGPALEIVTKGVGVVTFIRKGLDAKVTAHLVDKNGSVVWRKSVWYRSTDYGRG